MSARAIASAKLRKVQKQPIVNNEAPQKKHISITDAIFILESKIINHDKQLNDMTYINEERSRENFMSVEEYERKMKEINDRLTTQFAIKHESILALETGLKSQLNLAINDIVERFAKHRKDTDEKVKEISQENDVGLQIFNMKKKISELDEHFQKHVSDIKANETLQKNTNSQHMSYAMEKRFQKIENELSSRRGDVMGYVKNNEATSSQSSQSSQPQNNNYDFDIKMLNMKLSSMERKMNGVLVDSRKREEELKQHMTIREETQPISSETETIFTTENFNSEVTTLLKKMKKDYNDVKKENAYIKQKFESLSKKIDEIASNYEMTSN